MPPEELKPPAFTIIFEKFFDNDVLNMVLISTLSYYAEYNNSHSTSNQYKNISTIIKVCVPTSKVTCANFKHVRSIKVSVLISTYSYSCLYMYIDLYH